MNLIGEPLPLHFENGSILKKNIWDIDLQINLGLVPSLSADGLFFSNEYVPASNLLPSIFWNFAGLSVWPDWTHCFLLMEHYKNIISYYQEQLSTSSPWLMNTHSAIVWSYNCTEWVILITSPKSSGYPITPVIAIWELSSWLAASHGLIVCKFPCQLPTRKVNGEEWSRSL